MAAPVAIRPYRDIDSLAVERCLAALQEFEAAFEPNRADPLQYAPGYREHLLTQCRESAGRLFVAELKGDIVGLVCVLARADSGDLVEKSREHAYVTDLVVLPAHRGTGIGRDLLRTAEEYAASLGGSELKIDILAANHRGLKFYCDMGYQVAEVRVVKKLTTGDHDAA
jgi:GNAT superfamily N-acetyltransferase